MRNGDDEMSEPVAWRYWNSKWGEYSYTEDQEEFRCTLEPLYTHPNQSELVKAADEMRELLLKLEKCYGPSMVIVNLRTALDKVKS